MKKIRNYNEIFSQSEKENIINDYVNNKLSIKDISLKYNIKSKSWISGLLGDKIRSISEANKVAHVKYPESFKHSEETKKIMREKRLSFMKEHPEKTAWRQSNMSYPEKCFQNIIKENNLDKKYLIYREYSVFPYFIDFAFINEKIAFEIDGSQHLNKDVHERDLLKDKLLIENGWKVVRITAKEIISNKEKITNNIFSILDNVENINDYSEIGLLKAPKTKVKKERGSDGLTDGERQRALNSRIVKNRPSKEELFELLSNNSFLKVSKMFNVSDNTIRKWCKSYNIPFKKSEYKKLL